MLFNSFDFIFYFLPIAFVGYFLLNRVGLYKVATLFLICMSLFFYGYNKIEYLWIILCSIGLNYFLHRILIKDTNQREETRKKIFIAGIIANVGILYYFKYFNFTLEIFESLTGMNINIMQIALPLGISFFTFQQIGFVADSYKREIKKQDFFSYALFVSFFPQLIAGPIVSHEEMLPQFEDREKRKIHLENVMLGIRAFVCGLSKKVLVADTLGRAVNWGYEYYSVLDGFNTACIIVLYSLQLYFDFSGYCDMARGLGYLFNIKIPLNFNSPFKSKNVVEFWKRWHMTLGRFFTRYVYIPLGGNQKGFARALLNIFIVFCISGIWHGAGWTFVVWGLLHAVAQIVTRLWWKAKEKLELPEIKNKVINKFADGICVLACFLFVAFAFGIFRAESLSHALGMYKQLAVVKGFHIFQEIAAFLSFSEVSHVLEVLGHGAHPRIQMSIFLLVTVGITWGGRNLHETEAEYKAGWSSLLFYGALFVWCVLSLSNVSTFLYFNF